MSKTPPLTVESFEVELRKYMKSFFERVPFKTRINRVLTEVWITNVETDEFICHKVNYDLSAFENVFRIEEKMLSAGWYPIVIESTYENRVLTLEDRQRLMGEGLSFEDAYSARGVQVPVQITWLVWRVKLIKNTLVLKNGERRLVVRFAEKISEFLKQLRSRALSPEQGWEIIRRQDVKETHALR